MSDPKIEFLCERLPFWDELSEREQGILAGGARIVRYKKDSVIYNGSGDLGVLIIRRGRVYACTVTEEGREFVLLRLFAGDFCLLASSHVMEDIKFTLYINAEAETELLILDSSSCAEICRDNPRAEAFLRRTLSSHFSDMVINMQSMLLVSAEKRIAAFICAEADRTGTTRVKATHEQIARHVGSAREVVSRTLGRLAAEGAVSLERGLIVIRDKEKLVQRAATK